MMGFIAGFGARLGLLGKLNTGLSPRDSENPRPAGRRAGRARLSGGRSPARAPRAPGTE